jgi:hypothetical protein
MSRFTCGLTLLLALAPAALAVDGTVLINQSMTTNGLTGCPTGGHFPIIICQSGSYRLSGNLTVPDANTTAIEITTDNVSVDLNGFSILGPTVCGSSSPCANAGTGIGIDSFLHDVISVSNGTIRGMGNIGIRLFNGRALRVERVQVMSNGFTGIVANGVVSDCIVFGNGFVGIASNGTVMNNTVIANLSDGISGIGTFMNNTISGNSGSGMNVQHSLISGNTITRNLNGGISMACPGNIIGNLIEGGVDSTGTGCQLFNNVTP